MTEGVTERLALLLRVLALACAGLSSACNSALDSVPAQPATGTEEASSSVASSLGGASVLPPRITGAEPATIPRGETLTFDKAYALVELRNDNLLDLRRSIERSRVNYQSVAAGYASDWQATAFGRAQPPLSSGTGSQTPFLVNNNASSATSATSNVGGSYFDVAGAELRWTLPWWHKEGIKFDAQSSQIDIAIAQENYEANEKAQAANLLKAYVQVRLYQEKVRVSTEQLNVDRSRRDVMLKGQKIGKQSDLDLISQEGDAQNQEAITAHLQYQLSLKVQALFDILNVPQVDVKFCRNYFEFFTFDSKKWDASWAVEEQSRMLNLQIAKQEIQKQKADIVWEPSLALSSAYWRQWEVSFPHEDQNVLGLGATFTVPVPNFAQSAASQELARHDMNDFLAKLDEEVLRTKRIAQNDSQQIPVLAANLKKRMDALANFSKELAETRRSFELGLITYLQVQTTENTIQQNTQQFYDDMADYVDLVIDYARLHGRPFPVPRTCATG